MHRDEEVADLVRRWQAGDRDALGVLFERYGGLVRHVVRAHLPRGLRRRYDSLDFRQSVFGDVMEQARTFEFRGRAAFEGWLRRMAVLKIRHRYRGFVRGDGAPREAGLETTSSVGPEAPGDDPSERAALAEEIALLRSIVEALPATTRQLVWLVHAERITFADAARRLGLAGPDAARMRYARALRQIADAWPTA